MKKRVLILCTGNSCRSQMTEAIWRQVAGDEWDSFSAGSNPAGYVHPLAVSVMKEVGIDLTSARSKHVEEFTDQPFDLVVTVCDGAKEACPVFPGAKQQKHWPFQDPAGAEGTEEEKLGLFRRVRDQIRERIAAYLEQES
ncbi:MAG: arsenate reductase ArsC [Phycisphaerae bacterium]|nr:arsenate reductase ArsC [Phycisphaerae bacterium]